MAPTPYPNRSDLRGAGKAPMARFTGQTYGTGVQQTRAQQMVPAVQGGTAPPPAGSPAPPQPGATPFDRPTERPDEPVTAGAPVGAGGGPEALPFIPQRPAPGSPQDIYEKLRGLAAVEPNPNLLSIIAALMRQTAGQ